MFTIHACLRKILQSPRIETEFGRAHDQPTRQRHGVATERLLLRPPASRDLATKRAFQGRVATRACDHARDPGNRGLARARPKHKRAQLDEHRTPAERRPAWLREAGDGWRRRRPGLAALKLRGRARHSPPGDGKQCQGAQDLAAAAAGAAHPNHTREWRALRGEALALTLRRERRRLLTSGAAAAWKHQAQASTQSGQDPEAEAGAGRVRPPRSADRHGHVCGPVAPLTFKSRSPRTGDRHRSAARRL